MTWELSWEGRATDFIPDLLKTSGSPGLVAHMTKSALWELIQSAGERNSSAWVGVVATGSEDKSEPGVGKMSLSLEVKADYDEDPIVAQLRKQQPVDLLRLGSVSPPSAPEGSPVSVQGANEDR